MSYYFTADGKNVQGPAELVQIASWVRAKKLPANIKICRSGDQAWKPVTALIPAIQLDPSGAASAPGAPTNGAAVVPQAAPAQAAPAQAIQDGPSPRPVNVQDRPAETALARRESTALSGTEEAFEGLAVPSTNSVRAKDHVAPGTTFHTLLGGLIYATITLSILAVLGFSTFGIAPLIMGLLYWVQIRRGHAMIHGGSVHVTPDQFPEIHRAVAELSERLGIEPPEVYIAEASLLNAMAAKLGKRKYVILLHDLVEGFRESGELKSLAFVIAHELAHHALGHTSLIRSGISTTWKPLSRCDELSCDAVAAALVEDREACARGLGMLLVGPQLLRFVNWQALDRQAEELLSNKVWKGAESKMSHPLLLRRYARMRESV